MHLAKQMANRGLGIRACCAPESSPVSVCAAISQLLVVLRMRFVIFGGSFHQNKDTIVKAKLGCHWRARELQLHLTGDSVKIISALEAFCVKVGGLFAYLPAGSSSSEVLLPLMLRKVVTAKLFAEV